MSYIEGHAYFGCPIFFSISNKLEGENGERSSNTLVMIPSMDLKLLEAIDHGDFEFIQKKVKDMEHLLLKMTPMLNTIL